MTAEWPHLLQMPAQPGVVADAELGDAPQRGCNDRELVDAAPLKALCGGGGGLQAQGAACGCLAVKLHGDARVRARALPMPHSHS